MFSAKNVGGKRLHELARSGIELPRKPCVVTISKLECTLWKPPLFTIETTVSSGTYIRSLVNDIGEDLKCYAYIGQLIRTRQGSFKEEHCLKRDQWSIQSFKDNIHKYRDWLKMDGNDRKQNTTKPFS
eukprot:TRINITY_DN1170_c0_g1_i3.p1 TRINITY_DN1170_c0_g1~~TRINITY_DN1170_c0_g1_i3.p1  ORF type:complete len:128 (-),score=21.74 TRINITY_DN1170_c0_g1_i3:67-450(-)